MISKKDNKKISKIPMWVRTFNNIVELTQMCHNSTNNCDKEIIKPKKLFFLVNKNKEHKLTKCIW